MTCVACNGKLEPAIRYRFESTEFKSIYCGVNIHRCTECGLRQANISRVDAGKLSAYYREGYRVGGIGRNDTEAESRWYRARALALADLVSIHAAQVRSVFEIGAGYGHNLIAIGERYPHATLATDEPDAGILPAEIRVEPLHGPYDVIVISHVLEHVTAPHAFLARAGAALAPHGLLVIEVPHDTLPALHSQAFHEPHLTFFETESLRALLARVELEPIEVFTAGPAIARRTLMRHVKAIARRVAPWLKRFVPTPATPDFSERRPDGLFLRAVLKKH
jgi:SAM-dependent methyltransferase